MTLKRDTGMNLKTTCWSLLICFACSSSAYAQVDAGIDDAADAADAAVVASHRTTSTTETASATAADAGTSSIEAQEYNQLRNEMSQHIISSRAFAATMCAAAMAILAFFLKALLDIRSDAAKIVGLRPTGSSGALKADAELPPPESSQPEPTPNQPAHSQTEGQAPTGTAVATVTDARGAELRHNSRNIALLGIFGTMIPFAVLLPATYMWHLAAARIAAYLRIFYEEGLDPQGCPRPAYHAAGWFMRTYSQRFDVWDQSFGRIRDHRMVFPSSYLFDTLPDADVVCGIAFVFVFFSSVSLALVATHDAERSDSEETKDQVTIVSMSKEITKTAWFFLPLVPILFGFWGLVTLLYEQIPRGAAGAAVIGLISACGVVYGVYRVEHLDVLRNNSSRNVASRTAVYHFLWALTVAFVFNYAHAILDLKSDTIFIEAQWRCVRARESNPNSRFVREVCSASSSLRSNDLFESVSSRHARVENVIQAVCPRTE